MNHNKASGWWSKLFLSRSSSSPAPKAATTPLTPMAATTGDAVCHDDNKNNNPTTTRTAILEARLRTALWCFFAGDALASPTHWYYGGFPQIQRDYGRQGITDYTKPVYHLSGSILNKSNLNGGGRRISLAQRTTRPPYNAETTIVGDVILHGKQDLWAPDKEIHYHATLQAGESTLEASLGRVLLRSLAATDGVFDADHFRSAYMDFLQTPGSHNDTYASTCHRMFFANLVHYGKPPSECPDNDHHNVVAIDGLVLPTLVSLVTAARLASSHGQTAEVEVGKAAAACVAVTRKADVLEHQAAAWGQFLARALWRDNDMEDNDGSNNNDDTVLSQNVALWTRQANMPRPRGSLQNTMTACYLDSALPALRDNLLLWQRLPVWEALLANANTGGENVHRGSCLGAALGVYATKGATAAHVPEQLKTGLWNYREIAAEIDAIVDVVFPQREQQDET